MSALLYSNAFNTDNTGVSGGMQTFQLVAPGNWIISAILMTIQFYKAPASQAMVSYLQWDTGPTRILTGQYAATSTATVVYAPVAPFSVAFADGLVGPPGSSISYLAGNASVNGISSGVCINLWGERYN